MQKSVGWLWIVGFFVALSAADAQTSSPSTPSTQFDGTYAFVSSTKLNETYMDTWRTRMRPCGNMRRGRSPLTIVNGQARYHGFGPWTAAGFEGTVGSQGELAMRLVPTPSQSYSPLEIIVSGRIDGNGTVSARQMGSNCSYDLIWQKSK